MKLYRVLQPQIKTRRIVENVRSQHVVLDLIPSVVRAVKGKTPFDGRMATFAAIDSYFNHATWSLEKDEWNTQMTDQQKQKFAQIIYDKVHYKIAIPPSYENEERVVANKNVLRCPYCGTKHQCGNDPMGEDIQCCGQMGHVIEDTDDDDQGLIR